LPLDSPPALPVEPTAPAKTQAFEEESPIAQEGDLRFTGIIPFKRMDEAEAVSYELRDERATRFREAACDRFFPARAVLESAGISLDPEGGLHIACENGGSKAGMDFLSHPDHLRELEGLAKEAGYPGQIVIERANGEAEPVTGTATEKPLAATKQAEQDDAVSVVLKVLGGQVLKVTPLVLQAEGSEEAHDEPE